jgi:hypothetical protein
VQYRLSIRECRIRGMESDKLSLAASTKHFLCTPLRTGSALVLLASVCRMMEDITRRGDGIPRYRLSQGQSANPYAIANLGSILGPVDDNPWCLYGWCSTPLTTGSTMSGSEGSRFAESPHFGTSDPHPQCQAARATEAYRTPLSSCH